MSAAVDPTPTSPGTERHRLVPGAFLERADYVSADHARRVELVFDWQRAAANLTPWRVRVFTRRPHDEHGQAWRLQRRAYHRVTLSAALGELRPWLERAVDPEAIRRPRPSRAKSAKRLPDDARIRLRPGGARVTDTVGRRNQAARAAGTA